MTLKSKIVVAIATVMALSTLGSIAAITLLYYPSYVRLDTEIAARRAARIEKTLSSEAESLGSAVRDWAQWDDTFYFVRDGKADYIEKNLKPVDLANIKVDLMAVIDLHQQITFRAGQNSKSALFQSFVVGTPSPFALPIHALAAKPFDVVSGFGFVGKTPVVISVGTVLNSDRKGPSPGKLIFVRQLTPELMANLAERAGASFAIAPPRASNLAGMAKDDHGNFTSQDTSEIHSVLFLNNLTEDPGAAISLSSAREFAQVGRQTTIYTSVILAISGIVLCFVGFYIAMRLVTSPLSRIASHMERLSTTGSLDEKLNLERHDEIGVVANGLDTLMTELDTSRQAQQTLLANLAEKNKVLKAAVRTADIARAEAQTASRAKSAFLSNVSHELRTPLNAIIGFSDMIGRQMRGPVTSHYLDYAGEISRAGHNLLGLINQVIDVSRLEIGKIELHPSLVDPAQTAREVIDTHRDQAEKSHVGVSVTTPPQPVFVQADPMRFAQILSALLHNAIKFSLPGGEAKIDVSATAESVTITVSDRGVGMAKDHLEAVAKPFHQVEDTWARNYGGLGLGLGLSRGLAELHGARFAIASQIDQGTTVTLTFARAFADSTAENKTCA